MANLGAKFDATQVDSTDSYDPLPAGTYAVVITDSQMRDTKAGNGQYLQLEMEVIDGQMKGRKVFDRLNLVNPNQQAVDIAQKTLSQICHATGVLQVQDSEQLHNKPMAARVKVRDGDANYGPSNSVAGYKALAQQQPQANQSVAPAAQASKVPWG